MDVAADAIDRYVDELRIVQRRRGATDHELMDEVVDHLRSIQEELVAAGVGTAESAQRAVERFGPAEAVGADPSSTWRSLGFDLVLLAAVVLTSWGLAGALDATVRALVGDGWPGRSDSAHASRDAVRLAIGLVGLGIGELVWLGRGGRRLAPVRQIVGIGTVFLAALACGMLTVAAVTAIAGDGDTSARWTGLGVAFVAGTIAYPRVRARMASQPTLEDGEPGAA